MARHPHSGDRAAVLARVRGKAPTMRPNVRRLAAFASVHSCRTAAVAFAARIDTNRVLADTSVEVPFGQSPFAIGRGVAFENLLRRHGHAELRRVLTEGLHTDFTLAAIENLREGYPPNLTGLALRANVTRTRMAEICSRPPEPVVLDGAVLRADVGGLLAYFEADEMAIGLAGEIIVGENKSWPVVDGKPTDEDALGAALDQAATYNLLGCACSSPGTGRPASSSAATLTASCSKASRPPRRVTSDGIRTRSLMAGTHTKACSGCWSHT
jgi:hypothetical protein